MYKYQIREHPQNMRLGNMLDDLCDVHNHFLKLENRYYRIYGKYAGRYRLQPHLTNLLQRTHQHWAWIPRDTLDAVIIRLHLAWERFFDIPGCGRPKFKRKGRYRSAKFQTAYLLEEGHVRISFKEWDESTQTFKFNKRWFSFHQHREWQGKVCYIQILRKDWHYKLATDLCRRFDFIAAETLTLEGMKRLWGRKVSDLSFGEFVDILKFKCFKHNREFRQVGQWTPTTKPCSDCGYHNQSLSLSDRQWTCPECGSYHDRDINAAINILRAARGPVVETM